jgi:exopolysaccharide biosynthesis operon protein EpsL
MTISWGMAKQTKTGLTRNTFHPKLIAAVTLATAPAVSMAGGAAYNLDPLEKMQNTDTLNFIVGAQVRHDNNLFRLDSGEQPPNNGNADKSDTIYSTNVGVRLDKQYSLQRFVAEAMVRDHRFQNNSFLDYTAFNYRAAWHYAVTPRITGLLLAEQKEEQNSFVEFREARKNIQTSNVRLFTIDGEIGGGFHALAGLLDVRARNSVDFEQVGDYQQDGFELGGKWVAPSNNWISVLHRVTDGEFRGRELDPVSQLDTGFDQEETEANFFWRFTGKSVVDGKIAYVKREHDNFSDRDFSGMTGRVAYHWEITGKTSLHTSLSRNIYNYQEDENSYYVEDRFSIGPEWQYSPKTSFRARYDYSERDYRGAIVPVAETRDDKLQSFLIAADWKAARSLLVTGILQRDKRSSNIEDNDYNATSVSINAQFLF